jgi:hypothetical protein
MKNFDVVPGRALGPVVIGSTDTELLRALGQPASRRPAEGSEALTLFWYLPSLRVDIDFSGLVEFAELSWGPAAPAAATYAGIDLLGTPVEAVASALIISDAGYFAERGHSFVCPNGLALWRPVLPDGEDTQEDEYRNGAFWATVAVAAPGYW